MRLDGAAALAVPALALLFVASGAVSTGAVTRDPPAQAVSAAAWPAFAGTYRLVPDGWTLTVELRDGTLYGGRDPGRLKPFVPLAPNVFVLSGTLGEWLFVSENGEVVRIVDFRKFEPLVWTRVPGGR